MGKRLFVGNLAYSTADQDLRDLFSRVGTCASASVLSDRETGRSRGFGFVEMSTDEEAQRAVAELNLTELQGRSINVTEARERGEARPPRPPSFRPSQSSYGGGGGGEGTQGGWSSGGQSPPRKEGGSRRGLRGRKRSL